MSSGDEEYNRSGTGEDLVKAQKKSRVGRACDTCRRKKIRCDYASNPDKKCSNCAAYNLDCTYLEAAKKRGPPKGYVESLEARLRKMESLLQRLCPDADFTQELGASMDRETWWNERNNPGGNGALVTNVSLAPIKKPAGNKRKGTQAAARNSSNNNNNASNGIASEDNLSDDESVLPPLSEGIQKLSVGSMDRRFHGKSSGLVLVRTAMDMKRELIGKDTIASEEERKSYAWNEWETKHAPDTITFDFPPPDLMISLIQLYFSRNNLYLPLLHRPTFERQFQSGLHLCDSGFACVLLLVCAIASRFSDDPRVLRSDPDVNLGETLSQQTAGWKYFDHVQMQRKSLITPVSLFDLQQYALSGIFLHGSAAPYASWVTVGIGLRVAQDVGAHRKRNEQVTTESELWKRAFWVLVNLDRLSSAALGRPCAIHDEDFDLDPPLEVDDEYWERPEPESAFQQPPDKPSSVAFFNSLIKLDQMLSFALRTIYSINKSKIIGVSGENSWAQDTVAELDTRLNKWITTVPDHLRWDPTTPSDYSIFSQQSAILYATYYYIQILVHRPFIPRPGKAAPLSYPSLDICTNAARSCGQVLDAYRRNCDIGSAPFLMFYAFTSGLVSLLNIWGMRKHGSENDPDLMQDVHRCMQYLKIAQNKWHLAGRLCEILCELASAGDFPLPQPSPIYRNKREHDCDNPKSVAGFTLPNAPVPILQSAFPRPVRNKPFRPGTIPNQTMMDVGGVTQLQLDTSSSQLGNLREYSEFVPANIPVEASNLATMPWYPQSMNSGQQQQQPTFESLGTFFGATNPQNYNPTAEPPFQSGTFPPEASSQPTYMDLNQGFPNSEQNPSWDVNGVTLNMWSMAPPGFECEDWNHFVTNIAPGSSRPEDHHPVR